MNKNKSNHQVIIIATIGAVVVALIVVFGVVLISNQSRANAERAKIESDRIAAENQKAKIESEKSQKIEESLELDRGLKLAPELVKSNIGIIVQYLKPPKKFTEFKKNPKTGDWVSSIKNIEIKEAKPKNNNKTIQVFCSGDFVFWNVKYITEKQYKNHFSCFIDVDFNGKNWEINGESADVKYTIE